jgi:hypothetical protein
MWVIVRFEANIIISSITVGPSKSLLGSNTSRGTVTITMADGMRVLPDYSYDKAQHDFHRIKSRFAMLQVSLIAASASDETPGTVAITTADGMWVLLDYSYDNAQHDFFCIKSRFANNGDDKESLVKVTMQFTD